MYCSIVSSKCAQEKFHKCHISTTQCVSAGGWVVQLEGQQFDTTRSFTIEILKTDQSRADFSLWWKKEQDYCCCCFSNSQSQKFPPRKLIRFVFLFFAAAGCRWPFTIWPTMSRSPKTRTNSSTVEPTVLHHTRHGSPLSDGRTQEETLKKESHWDPEVKTKQKPKPDSWLVSCLSVVLMCSLNSL